MKDYKIYIGHNVDQSSSHTKKNKYYCFIDVFHNVNVCNHYTFIQTMIFFF